MKEITEKSKKIIKNILKSLINSFIGIAFYLIKQVVRNKPQIASLEDTMVQINRGKSLARFGDGEFEAITGNIPETSFQKNSLKLSKAIKRSFETENPSLMIAISSTLSWNLSDINKEDRKIWKRILLKDWWKWRKEINKRNFYYNAYVTRPYFQFSQNYSHDKIKSIFDSFKNCWNNKNILLVEGKYTRFGVNDDLLNQAGRVERIICPPSDAFKKIEEIELAIRNHLKKHDIDIVLISLGPTASILACNLIDTQVQVLDIGHLDLEYNWFLANATEKITPIGKYNNEGLVHFIEFKDLKMLKEYNDQIIEVIN